MPPPRKVSQKTRNAFEALKAGSNLLERKRQFGQRVIAGQVVFIPRALAWPKPDTDALRVLDIVKREVSGLLKPDRVKMARGKEMEILERRVGFFHLGKGAETYNYTNVEHNALTPPVQLQQELRDLVKHLRGESVLGGFEGEFTNFHMNRYTPKGHLGYHADNIEKMDLGAPIVSISLGATRVFRVATWVCGTSQLITTVGIPWLAQRMKNARRVKTSSVPLCVSREYVLNHGDVVVMMPHCQVLCKHTLIEPRASEMRALKEDPVHGGIRYNITLRKFVT